MEIKRINFYFLEGGKRGKSINSQVAALEGEILSFLLVRMLHKRMMEEMEGLFWGLFWGFSVYVYCLIYYTLITFVRIMSYL